MTSLYFFVILACDRDVNLSVSITDERSPIASDSNTALSAVPDDLQALMDACVRCHSDWGTDLKPLQRASKPRVCHSGSPEDS